MSQGISDICPLDLLAYVRHNNNNKKGPRGTRLIGR